MDSFLTYLNKNVPEDKDLNQKIIQWAFKFFSSHGYKLKTELPENVLKTPWSYVIRFATSVGYIYLKHTPKSLFIEANITKTLHDQFHASVPEIIAHNAELNCFLMKDSGMPLRRILNEQFDYALICKAIDQFTSMQLIVTEHINIFLDMGVPDWRLDKLPYLYKELLLQKHVLIEDGLSELELSKLAALLPNLSSLCEKLSEYSVKETIVQCDFHDNNILIAEPSQDITFIDLGEIVISHPFFSLIGCLRQIKKHHALINEDQAYKLIMQACLKNYMIFGSKENLLDAFYIARKIWIIYEALAQYRLRLACDEESFIAFQKHGRLSQSLKEFMSVLD